MKQEATDLLRNVFPISGQQFVPMFRYANQTPAEGVMHGLGLSVMPDESPAYQKAVKLASDRGPDQAMDPGKLRHYEFIDHTEQALHNGTLQPSAIGKFVENGQLTIAEAHSIRRTVAETRGITDPMTARLVLKVRRLPMADALQVWQLADNQERAALAREMNAKRRRYRENAWHDMTAKERQKDALFQKLGTLNFE